MTNKGRKETEKYSDGILFQSLVLKAPSEFKAFISENNLQKNVNIQNRKFAQNLKKSCNRRH